MANSGFKFWCLSLQPNTEATILPPRNRVLKVSHVALGKDAHKQRTVVSVRTKDQNDSEWISLCSLSTSRAEQFAVDLIFPGDEPISFEASGPSQICITGFLQPLEEYDPNEDNEEGGASTIIRRSERQNKQQSEPESKQTSEPTNPVMNGDDHIHDNTEPEQAQTRRTSADSDSDDVEIPDDMNALLAPEKGQDERKDKHKGDLESTDSDVVMKGSVEAEELSEEVIQKSMIETPRKEDKKDKRRRRQVKNDTETSSTSSHKKRKRRHKRHREENKDTVADVGEMDFEVPQFATSSDPSDSAGQTASSPSSAEKDQEKEQERTDEPATPSSDSKSPKSPKTPKSSKKKKKKKKWIQTHGGVKYRDHDTGDGAVIKHGKRITVKYSGSTSEGGVFDNNDGKPLSFKFGMNEVVKGWDFGLEGARVGSRRKMVVPPKSVGAQNAKNVPQGKHLNYIVEILSMD